MDEFKRGRALIDREVTHPQAPRQTWPKKLLVGAMIEVPALALAAAIALLPLADFVSVGSNDLMQFLFATDRGNTLVADRFDRAQARRAPGAPR